MERISISREAPYVGDENIYQYGYGICGLHIMVWQMGLQWHSSKGRTFVWALSTYKNQSNSKNLLIPIRRLFYWWLRGYLPSYIKDITSIIALHPNGLRLWRRTWQESVDNCGCLFSHPPVFFLLTLAHR